MVSRLLGQSSKKRWFFTVPGQRTVLIPWALRATHMADLALDMVIIITEEQEDGEEKRLPNPTPTSLELCF